MGNPMNPRTLSFWPPSPSAIEHLYVLPFSGFNILPPGPLFALLPKVPENTQTDEWPAFHFAITPVAAWIGVIGIGIDEFLNPAV
jgi:hypothetical protein